MDHAELPRLEYHVGNAQRRDGSAGPKLLQQGSPKHLIIFDQTLHKLNRANIISRPGKKVVNPLPNNGTISRFPITSLKTGLTFRLSICIIDKKLKHKEPAIRDVNLGKSFNF